VKRSTTSKKTRTEGGNISRKVAAPSRRIATGDACVLREIFAITRSPEFARYLQQLLTELCSIDTTPKSEIELMRQAESKCFAILERELGGLGHPGARLERRPINPEIQSHRNYSLLHFTKTSERPQGLPPEAVYADRSNLLYILPGTKRSNHGASVALNAHLDVVAPYFPPKIKGSRVLGRGACDDKGPVVGIVGALKVLQSVMAKSDLTWNRNVVSMFVVEEETGGNGSLSLAIDRELKSSYESVLVSECTGLKFHPANRGAVWYRAEIKPPAGVCVLELFAYINEELEKEGAALRAESRHPLFPTRPVQTCHGIIGLFGEHPSRICGHVSFLIEFDQRPGPATRRLVEDCLEAALAGYTGLYGDKSQALDPATGKPMVPRHYELRAEAKRLKVEVYGAAGHMGSIRERDGAITKMAHLVRGLVASRTKIEKSGGNFTLLLDQNRDAAQGSALVAEGGQGFVPTHSIEEVMERLRNSAQRGAEDYLRRTGRTERGEDTVTVTYEKLHNVAFDGDPNSPMVSNAVAAARACGIWKDEPVLGWTVSCDARLFATEYPGLPVLTFGPGQLMYAHSDQEQIDIEEIRSAVECLAVFLLLQTGTIPPLD
jgi:acetylornithine deacetylase/succinyl-diaminopimelate desuccinylase-like protein